MFSLRPWAKSCIAAQRWGKSACGRSVCRTAAEDIFTPDGTLRVSKGEVPDSFTANADGVTETVVTFGLFDFEELTAISATENAVQRN